MSQDYYLKHKKEKIKLADKPFAGGGEGNLFKILSPASLKGYVAKIYHPLKRTAERAEKIEYLYQYPPQGLAANQHPAYIWISDILIDPQKQFMGFIMPFVKGEKLEVLCRAKLPKKLSSAWQRFNLKNPKAFEYRLRTCFNLAAAVYHVHSTQRYVIVDLKPENVIIQPNGLISLVDMDSVEVVEDGRVVFPAPVATPEYTPPEHYTKESRKHSHDGIDPFWDLFSLATIFYKMLFGIHPFAASANPPYDQMVSLHQKIQHGLFVHHPQKAALFKIIPPPHQAFEKLEEGLKELFLRCFVEGHQIPEERPLTEVWCMALLNVFGDAKMRAHFQNMFLLKRSTGHIWRKPSRLVALPKMKLAEEDVLPADYHSVLAWQAPKPQSPQQITKNIKVDININSTASTIFSIGSSVLLFFLLLLHPSFKNWIYLDLWTGNIFKNVLFILLFLIYPFLIAPILYYIANQIWNPQRSAWRRQRKQLQAYIAGFQQSTLEWDRIHQNFQNQLKQTLPNFYTLKQKIEQLQEDFKAWLEQMDQEVERLLEKEIQLTKEIEKSYVEKLSHQLPFKITAPKDQVLDLDQIWQEILKNKRAAIQAIKELPVEERLVSSNPEIRKFIDEEIKNMEWKQQNFLKETEQRRNLLRHQQERDEKSLHQALKEEANIRGKYHQYFKQLGHKKKIVEKLQREGLNSILQIERIDHLRAQIELNNGKIIPLENITEKYVNLASKLGDWFIVVRKLKEEQKDELLRIQRFYKKEKQLLEQQKANSYQKYKKELNSIQHQAAKAYQTLKIRDLEQSYQQYTLLWQSSKEDFSAKIKEASQELNLNYEALIEKVKQEAQQREAAIRQLEAEYQQQSQEQLQDEDLEKISLQSLEMMEQIQQKATKINSLVSNLQKN